MRRTAPVCDTPAEVGGWALIIIGVILLIAAVAFAGEGSDVQKPQEGVPAQATAAQPAPEIHNHVESDGNSTSSIILAVGGAAAAVITAVGGLTYYKRRKLKVDKKE